MPLSNDAQAILLLCSHLALPDRPDPAPLTLREWNPVARRLQALEKRPGALLGLSAAELQGLLAILPEDATRLARLLERGGALAIAAERLAALGIWIVTRADPFYPLRLRQRLREAAPVLFYGAGARELPGKPGLAVVGSRNADAAGLATASAVGLACAQAGWAVYSGGARGVDRAAMEAALTAGGTSVGVLAESLERAIRMPGVRTALAEGQLTLMTPYAPDAGFSVGTAMGRNRLIYVLADYGLVVACEAGTGGTWAGATEALKGGWVPLFAVDGPHVPEGNRQLVQKGARPFPEQVPEPAAELPRWLAEHAAGPEPGVQERLF